MRIIQFQFQHEPRRLGVVEGAAVLDITSIQPELQTTLDAFQAAQSRDESIPALLTNLLSGAQPKRYDYAELLRRAVADDGVTILPPIDTPDPAHTLVSGTGLTHTGGMQARDSMHTAAEEDEANKTDSRKMFEMGLAGGKPQPGHRGAVPEWFYKGDGSVLRGYGQMLEIPPFAPDGGEEPEVAGLYVVDDEGRVNRLGFAIGNEWSDHVTEKQNYLYLAPSKLRTCGLGPELVTGVAFDDLEIHARVNRQGHDIYDSGALKTGEANMCHSLANCEDHHFKYPQHRRPGQVHVHYLGTSKLSYGLRKWEYQSGDLIEISCPALGHPLLNVVLRASGPEREVIRVIA